MAISAKPTTTPKTPKPPKPTKPHKIADTQNCRQPAGYHLMQPTQKPHPRKGNQGASWKFIKGLSITGRGGCLTRLTCLTFLTSLTCLTCLTCLICQACQACKISLLPTFRILINSEFVARGAGGLTNSLLIRPTDDVMRGIKMIMRKMADPLYF